MMDSQMLDDLKQENHNLRNVIQNLEQKIIALTE